MLAFNPARLDLARRRRGLSKSELAEAVELSSRMITAYERGEKKPAPRTMLRLADVLGFPAEFLGGADLEEPPIDGSSFRAMSRLTAKQRDRSLGSGTIALALSDWIEARFQLPAPDISRLQGIDPETAAMAIRGEWKLGEQPVRNMIHLIEAHGVRVFSLAEDCVEMDAFSFWRGDRPYVFLNTFKTAERTRMDAAHELGHLVLHWRGGARGRDTEHEADLFGSAFLMPRGSVLAEAPRNPALPDLITAKRRWNVAVSNLTYRMHALGLLSDWQYRSLFIEMGKKGYRHSEPNGAQAERSQVLDKVFQVLRDEGVSKAQIAKELNITTDELAKVVFGLVLTTLEGSPSRPGGTQEDRPTLQIV